MKLFRISPTNPKVFGYMNLIAENQQAAANRWTQAIAGQNAAPVANAQDLFTASRLTKAGKTIFEIKVTEESQG